ncbi:MAG: transglutaminase family protein [Rhodospirillales bacterium]|nr:transglutaminase family protein [Rhodospirillales bacterium]
MTADDAAIGAARTRAKEVLARLTTLCAAGGHDIDVVEAALTLSLLRRPALDLDPYRAHVAALAAEIGALVKRRHPPLDALREVLAKGYGYRGDRETYDDPQNADLASVIDRRRGLPVALGLVWMGAARAQGWGCVGLGFPGHFLIRLEAGGAHAILDPFGEGAALEARDLRALLRSSAGAGAEIAPAHVAAVPDADVLLRLENNIKTRQLRAGDDAGAGATIERMTAIAPGRAELWFEAATIHAGAGAVGGAVKAFDRFLALDAAQPPSPDPEITAVRARARDRAASLLRELRRRLN